MNLPKFRAFAKIPRLSRDCVITEKIDGTNGCIFVGDDFSIHAGSRTLHAGSRTRWITPEDDNFGFAAWVRDNSVDLAAFLGPGFHYGEWWGSGIQRGYGYKKGERFFSLFNTGRWSGHSERPTCCGVVPILYEGLFSTAEVDACLERLVSYGSLAAPGYMRPEGVIVFHAAANSCFKKTVDKDDVSKVYHQFIKE
jgi:hypothetical protein